MPHTQKNKTAPLWASIIVAAGSGTRFGGDTPKQFLPLLGRPVLYYSLARLAPIGKTIIVVDDPENSPAKDIIKDFAGAILVQGGKTRSQSVKSGLNALKNTPPDYVLIHDAARPLLDAQSLTRIMAEIESGTLSATLGTPVHDTIMRGSNIIDRSHLHTIQTPQAFDFKAITSAHDEAEGEFTDDASLVHSALNIPTTIIPGNKENFKITTPDDLTLATKTLLANLPETRTGMAFDVHRFGPEGSGGGYVTLCGVRIPSPRPLTGHSDADAPLHALADAILGTIGAGDIGVHFPPTDPKWKNMDSGIIVEKALELLHEKGGVLRHVDIMIMTEHPKIGPHRDAIKAHLGKILNLPLDAIGLKATTMEEMGFVGRGEGLTTQVAVTVRLPIT